MVVGINSIVELLINEITHPRLSTLIITVVGILLIFGGIQSRLNRRKWAAHLAYLEALNGDAEADEENDDIDDLPDPVVEDEVVDEMVYDDDDIELI